MVAAEGLPRRSRVSRRNADLKYARNARENESRYSIIVGLPHLHLHSGLPRRDNPPFRARKDEPTTATSNFPVGVIAREESDYTIVCSDSSTETDRMTRLERVIERERNLRTYNDKPFSIHFRYMHASSRRLDLTLRSSASTKQACLTFWSKLLPRRIALSIAGSVRLAGKWVPRRKQRVDPSTRRSFMAIGGREGRCRRYCS